MQTCPTAVGGIIAPTSKSAGQAQEKLSAYVVRLASVSKQKKLNQLLLKMVVSDLP
jgi:hypothetical protein